MKVGLPKRRIQAMPFRGLKSMPFRGKHQCPFEANKSISSTYLLMSSSMQSQDNHVSQFYNKILSTHGRGFSTSMASPTNPFTPRLLFPPKGEWSLHTRYKIIPQSQQNQENRPNTIRSNMLIHNTTITTYAKCNHKVSFKHTLTYTFPTFTRWE